MFYLRHFIKNFSNAWRGLKIIFREEANFPILIIIAVLVLIVAIVLHVELWQFIILIFIIILTLVLELINSIFERIMDILKPRLHDYVGDIKDIMTAVVFISSLGAVIIGIFIFLPRILEIIK